MKMTFMIIHKHKFQLFQVSSFNFGHCCMPAYDSSEKETEAMPQVAECTLALSLPCDHKDPIDVGLPAQVHHPDGFLHVEVVQDGATVQALVCIAIHSPRCMTMHPLITDVTLVVTTIIYPRLLLKSQVLNWRQTSKTMDSLLGSENTGNGLDGKMVIVTGFFHNSNFPPKCFICNNSQ